MPGAFDLGFDLRASAHHIDLWVVDLEPGLDLGPFLALLDPDERARAARFHFERHNRRFVIARAALRTVLGRYTGRPADTLRFEIAEHGKPSLPGSGVEFNLSHSHELAVLAVTTGTPLGVDVERLRAVPDDESLAARFFAPVEARTLSTLPADVREEAFFACWTRKEAFIKARGGGLSIPLDSFAVTLAPGNPPRFVHIESDATAAARWCLQAFTPRPGYLGALAYERQMMGWPPLPIVPHDLRLARS